MEAASGAAATESPWLWQGRMKLTSPRVIAMEGHGVGWEWWHRQRKRTAGSCSQKRAREDMIRRRQSGAMRCDAMRVGHGNAESCGETRVEAWEGNKIVQHLSRYRRGMPSASASAKGAPSARTSHYQAAAPSSAGTSEHRDSSVLYVHTAQRQQEDAVAQRTLHEASMLWSVMRTASTERTGDHSSPRMLAQMCPLV